MRQKELKGLRAKYELTQKDIATLLGITVQSYRSKENGNNDFTLKEAKKISDIFKKTIEEIFFTEKVYEIETKYTY